MRPRHKYLAAVVAATSVAVACTLNPQPLPPEAAATSDDGGGFSASSDSGRNMDPEAPPADAATAGPHVDGGDEGGAAPEPDGGDDDAGTDAGNDDAG